MMWLLILKLRNFCLTIDVEIVGFDLAGCDAEVRFFLLTGTVRLQQLFQWLAMVITPFWEEDCLCTCRITVLVQIWLRIELFIMSRYECSVLFAKCWYFWTFQ